MLLPRHREDLGFGDIEFLSMLPAVHFHSSLLSTHDVINVTPFNHNVHHRGLWAEAAYGSLKPPPTRRLRRAHLHLSYSMALARLLDTIPTKNSRSPLGCRAPLFELLDDRRGFNAVRESC